MTGRRHMPYEVCTCPNPDPGRPFHCAATVDLPADRPPADEPVGEPARWAAAVGQMRAVLMSTGAVTLGQVDEYAEPFTRAVIGTYLRVDGAGSVGD